MHTLSGDLKIRFISFLDFQKLNTISLHKKEKMAAENAEIDMKR
jgi:hypothetical protein